MASQPTTAAAGTPSQGGADSSGGVKKPKPSTVKNPGNAPAAPVGAASAATKPTAGAPAAGTGIAQSTPPALDLGSLEQRLKDTRAIGLFTKLSLKNQVDDLLNQFRAFHKKQATVTLVELRQKYDLLLLKVLSLLQDGDPPLAAAISFSREALWGILTDPEKFARI
jgi:hypothetical protein